jgi:hypothetical protein
MPEQEDIKTLTAKISEIYNELSSSTKGDSEFTVNNIQLPEYDNDAVQLFFGPQDKIADPSTKNLEELHQMFTDKINEILGKAKVLLDNKLLE